MRAGPIARPRAAAERGIVSIETLVVLVPLLTAFLGVAQVAALEVARLVVRHAATRALRAAVVVLDDDPENYEGVARGELVGGNGENIGPRLSAIRRAAVLPLAVLAPPMESALGKSSSLDLAVAGFPLERLAYGSTLYGPAAVSLTLHRAPGDDTPLRQIGPRDSFTVRLEYLFSCRVPLASALVCRSGRRILASELARENAAPTSVEDPNGRRLLLTHGRYVVIRVEASGVNQGATYHRGQP